MGVFRDVKFLTLLGLSVIALGPGAAHARTVRCDVGVLIRELVQGPEWKIANKTYDAKSGRLRVEFRAPSGVKRTVVIPWNAARAAQDAHYTDTLLKYARKFRLGEHTQLELFTAKNATPVAPVSQIASKQIENFVASADDLARLSPESAQTLLLDIERWSKIEKFLSRGSDDVVYARISPAASRNWTNRMTDYFANRPGFSWNKRPGVEELTIDLRQLGGSGMTEEEALEFFHAKLYFDLRSEATTVAQTRPNFAYSLRIVGGARPIHLHYLDGEALLRWGKQGATDLYAQYPARIRKFVFDYYRSAPKHAADQGWNFTPELVDGMEKFSARAQDRTRFVFLTDDTGNVKGAMSAVESRRPSEPLAMEEMAGIQLTRTPGKRQVEIGRFVVSPEYRDGGPKRIWQLAYLMNSTRDLERIVADTFKEYASELITKRGFRVLQDPGVSQAMDKMHRTGNSTWFIEMKPEQIIRNASPNSRGAN